MGIPEHITAWTDYPITELGDTPGQEAPIRQVFVVSWDGNKYASIIIPQEGRRYPIIKEIKVGYLYTQPGRQGEVPAINTSSIPTT